MISALLADWWRELGDAIEANRLELISSPQAISEFLDVARRPRLRTRIDAGDADEIANLLRRATLYQPAAIPSVCRDPNDDFLLALAVASEADVLVTRDEDLLILQRHAQTEITHVAGFLQRLAAATDS